MHEHVLLNGRAEYLSAPMEHYAFPDIATFVEKHNRYSAWEAGASERLHERAGEKTLRATPFGNVVERKRWLKKLATRAPFRPSLRFLYHYVWSRVFAMATADGCSVGCSPGMIPLKEREMKKRHPPVSL